METLLVFTVYASSFPRWFGLGFYYGSSRFGSMETLFMKLSIKDIGVLSIIIVQPYHPLCLIKVDIFSG